MIVIAASREASVEHGRRGAVDWEADDMAFAIEEKRAPIAAPVRSFESSLCEIRNAAIAGFDGDSLKRAVENRLGGGRGRRLREFDVGENCFLDDIFVVRADAEADVEVAMQRDAQPSSSDLRLAAIGR